MVSVCDGVERMRTEFPWTLAAVTYNVTRSSLSEVGVCVSVTHVFLCVSHLMLHTMSWFFSDRQCLCQSNTCEVVKVCDSVSVPMVVWTCHIGGW